MLFNLSCRRHFPSKLTGLDILPTEDGGPVFGGEDFKFELGASMEPMNGDEHCYSHAN